MRNQRASTIALIVLTYAAVTLVIQGASHFVINAEHYAAIPFLRAEPLIALGVASMIIEGTIFAVLFPVFAPGGGVRKGLVFSWWLGGLIASYAALAEAGKYAVPSIASWVAVEASVAAVQYTVFGVLLGLLHRAAPPAAVDQHA